MKKSILFVVSLAGGFLFGGLFFVAFGATLADLIYSSIGAFGWTHKSDFLLNYSVPIQ